MKDQKTQPCGHAGRGGFSAPLMDGWGRSLGTLDDLLSELAGLTEGVLRHQVEGLRERLRRTSPVVTIVGQVKAGKTALTNVLARRPGMLPSDVNPWTSVVTSVHMNPRAVAPGTAEFRFLSSDEWKKLKQGGGRLGEMARLVALDDESAELERQVDRMEAEARRRLGANFDMLLGGRHRFDYFDTPLLERYVCHGEQDGAPGRYSEMTRSADLYMEAPHCAIPLTLRDTPGVNDPFLVREQITLQALEDSDVCLLVLSAQQALTTSDVALVRILHAMKSDRVLLFVNRMDELDRPETEVPAIRAHIGKALGRWGLPVDIPVVFGSAARAQVALSPDFAGDAAAAWQDSGLPELEAALARAVAHGPAEEALRSLRADVANLLEAALRHAQHKAAERAAAALTDPEQIVARLEAMRTDARHRMERMIDRLTPEYRAVMNAQIASFADAECARFAEALSRQADAATWQADANMLRGLFHRAYFAHATELRERAQEVLDRLAREMGKLYGETLGDPRQVPSIRPAICPESGPPVALSMTLALDMQPGWWSGWFRRKAAPEARIKDLRRIILAESRHVTDTLERENLLPYYAVLHRVVDDQIELHAAILAEFVAAPDGAVPAVLQDTPGPGWQTGTIIAHLKDLAGRLVETNAPAPEMA
ncbi:hypothetical protein HMH01_17380 [Halovulum dunhuangense]|uniref:Dynamin N-terminal domain-containing protein n=1 Tax=Halovulum dunhuangense TaxID=1505036 RepID=A0A849L871_9RHOB|nr:dynamin family protein [Halovulum dunhuangense]NNU82211.1 hypothetical protein [Halovulum dunhuangense]